MWRKKSAVWCLLIASLSAGPAVAQGIVTQQRQLRVQVLDQENHGLSTKITLRNYLTADLSAYTDRMGNANFYGVPAGSYILIVTIGETEVHRDQIALTNSQGPGNELVRLYIPSREGVQIVSVDELAVPKAAREYYNEGKEAIWAANWDRALEAFHQAIKAYPRYARAFNAMGVLLAATGRGSEAEPALRRAVELDPKSAESHFNLGKLLAESNRALEGKSELIRSLELGYPPSTAIDALIKRTNFMQGDDAGKAEAVSRNSK